MPSTYTVNLGIEKPATGEQSGTWGDTTNVNFDIIDQAVNGSERVTLTSAGTSGSPNDLNIVNGSTTSSEGRNKWIEIYSASDLGGSAYVRLVPNDAEKILFIRNSLAGSQSVLLFQGTYNASNDLEIPAGVDMVVRFDGAGASATVTDVFTKLRATEITTPTLTAATADINGGSVDGATVGAASASTGAFTTLTASTSLNIASSTTVDGVLDEDNMASDSATKLATQQSIKAYVDSQVGTVDTWAEVLANGATSGATNPEIDSGQALKTNTINETTAGSGVTIDSVLLKDDVVNATDIETSNISANDGTAAATIANSTGNFTITNFISNSVDIGGGAIDGTNIGASSAGTGAFTTLTASGLATLSANLKLPSNGTLFGAGDTGLNHYTNNYLYVAGGSNGIIFKGQGLTPEFAKFEIGATTFNEDGGDIDFRVESNGNTHMLFVDGGNNHLGIGESAPSELIHATQNGGDAVLLLENTGTSGTDDANIQLKTTLGTFTLQNDRSLDTQGAFTIAGAASYLQIDHADGNMAFNTSFINVNDTDPILRLYASNGGSGNGSPELQFYRDGGLYGSLKVVPNVEFRLTSPNAVGQLNFHANGDTQRLSLGSSAVFNDPGNDYDFRVEGDSNSHLLFVDASENLVTVGSSGGYGNLQVVGDNAASEYRTFFVTSASDITRGVAIAYDYANDYGVITAVDAGTGWKPLLVKNTSFNIDQGAVVNEVGGNYDFRVESDNNTHALFVDADADRIGLFESSPQQHVTLGGGRIFEYRGGSQAMFRPTANTNDHRIVALTDQGMDVVWGGAVTTSMQKWQNGNAVTFNDDGNDQDFRVESNSNASALYVDAGNNVTGTNVPFQLGAIGNGTNAQIFNSKSLTINTATDIFSVDMTSGAFACYIDVIQVQTSGYAGRTAQYLWWARRATAGNSRAVVELTNTSLGSVNAGVIPVATFTATAVTSGTFTEKFQFESTRGDPIYFVVRAIGSFATSITPV